MNIKQGIRLQMKKHIDKMLLNFSYLKFEETDGEFENVIFSNGDKNVKIAHHYIYGYSRISRKDIDEGERTLKSIRVTDEMYINDYVKPNVEKLLLHNGLLK